MIRNAFDTPDFVSYREAYRYIRGIDDMVDSIEELLDGPHAGDVAELAEYGLQQAAGAVQYMDDSDGGMGDVMYRLQELHLKSCEKAKQNPAKLAALRAQDHPLDAVEVYMKYVHPTIEQTNNKAYEEAVHLSKKIQSLMLRQRKDEAFTAYVDELRTRYKAKRNFIKLLDNIR